MTDNTTCFHCALPNPINSDFIVSLDGIEHSVCCPGCKAVAELIRDSGLKNYYALRDAPIPGTGRPPEKSTEWQAFDTDDMLRAFTTQSDSGPNAEIYVGGMYCSACSWLIETSLRRIDGVRMVEIVPLTQRLRISWRTNGATFGSLLAELARLGYQPQPLSIGTAARPEIAEQKKAMKRLLVASLGAMQVMMFAVALYAGDFQGIDAEMRRFLRLVSFFVATPVVFYAAKPFFISAWRGVVANIPGMDLPVSIAIGSAYAASVYSTFSNGPAVWFDSVAMFVFFLTLGRYLEMRARHRSTDQSIALSQALPNTASRILDGELRVVPVAQLKRGDLVLVRAGESIPVDGIVVSGISYVDEALMTGETTPKHKVINDAVAAGSVNVDDAVTIRVEKTGADTALSAIRRMSENARFARPTFVGTADRASRYIVVAVLLIAAATAIFWALTAPQNAFVITLSVLVVTCPCALALATPAAFATAASRMSALRMLLTDSDAIEKLSRATHIVFDKTGTLTLGNGTIAAITTYDTKFDARECRRIAAALERISTHPIARAFASDVALPLVDNAEVHVGGGISANLGGDTWRIGKHSFVTSERGEDHSNSGDVFLTCNGHRIARFSIDDEIKPDARETLDVIRAMGIGVSIASGDHDGAVAAAAADLSVTDYRSACMPDDKLAFLHELRGRGEHVVMVGDGINDSPVLAGADVSIAPSSGALLAQTNADLIMLGDALRPVATALRLSRGTMRVVRQNLAWAVGYNVIALPLAVTGHIPPWLAAIGMSASSLIVVLNALRLSRFE